MEKHCKNGKKGFTLIEVMVALSVLFIVILALLGSYYSYYSTAKQTMYKNIGQNLAEAMLEETRNLSVSVLDSLVKGGSYPAIWQKYVHSVIFPGCYEVTTGTPASDIEDGIPFPQDTNPRSDIYDSGIVNSSYRVQHITSVFGVSNSYRIPSNLLNNLPSTIIITPVHTFNLYTLTNNFDYTILYNKYVYPYYRRRIVIQDMTPSVSQVANKLYKFYITIYWNVGGSYNPSTGEVVGGETRSITIEGDKSFRD